MGIPQKLKMMKFKLIAIVATLALTLSCSSDSEDDGAEMMSGESNLIGTWNLSDVNFEDQSDIELNLAVEIVDNLAAEECYLVIFTFNADGTASAEDKTNFIEVNAGPNGLDVPCPTQSDTESSTWSLVGNQLTFINAELEEETIEIIIEGDTLIIAGEAIDPDNFTGAQAIFTRG